MPFAGLTKLPAQGKPASDKVSSVRLGSSFGYVIEWSEYYAPGALTHLLRKGVRVRAAWEPFTIDFDGRQVDFGRGSLLIPVPYRGVVEGDELFSAIADIRSMPGLSLPVKICCHLGRTMDRK
ncbi:MAG: hypothetical protein R2744_01500 [Bacteroidales bacterium]